MTIERDFDVAFVARLALREKQIQQNYRPVIAVHKWFARRPGTLFRGLLLAEFGDGPLGETFFRGNQLNGIRVADPFMGGGTPLLESNRLGCDVIGCDINPMAYWIVRQEIEHLDLAKYSAAADNLLRHLKREIGHWYNTKCASCSAPDANVKYFLWVKSQVCDGCGNAFDLFPGYLLAEDRRHPKNVFVCGHCGDLNEVTDRKDPGSCHGCGRSISRTGPATRGRCPCPHCGTINHYPRSTSGPLAHRMFAIEYHCVRCRPHHKGRFFKKPDREDLIRYGDAARQWQQLEPRFVPNDEIPQGDETTRLHRWGYHRYRQMFNDRQLLGLELSCRLISDQPDERIRNALATNLSDLLRYQNMLCRYDTMALKSLDIFSVHGFPVGLVQCESNLIGIPKHRGGNVGSGGWTNIIEKFATAKAYCDRPFEVRYEGKRKIQVPISGEWIGDASQTTNSTDKRHVELHCQSSTSLNIPRHSLDAVLTDPPYFGNVQYAELMDFCYVWLRRLASVDGSAFVQVSTRNENELTGNVTLERGLNHFVEGLSSVFQKVANGLKPGAPLAFTYHHNKLDAYYPVAVAILDAGLTCSASLPCPAEMAGSIHINGTGSSIVDTIFVCRSTGTMPRRWLAGTPMDLAEVVRENLSQLQSAGVTLTQGDVRCVIYGHLIRLAIWRLRQIWDKSLSAVERQRIVAKHIDVFGGLSAVEAHLNSNSGCYPQRRAYSLQEEPSLFGECDEVSF